MATCTIWPFRHGSQGAGRDRWKRTCVRYGEAFAFLKKIIQIWCPPEGLVLDPYAGSGSTGHAVLELNHDLGSSRRFILIEQGAPENGDKYARTLTWQRLKNAVTGERPTGKPATAQAVDSRSAPHEDHRRKDRSHHAAGRADRCGADFPLGDA